MDSKEQLQNMVDNLINQKPEQAQVDFRQFLQNKMQTVVQGKVAPKQESDKE